MIHEFLCKRDAWVDESEFEHEEKEDKKNQSPFALSPERITMITSVVGEPEEQECKRDKSDPDGNVQEPAIPGYERKK
jgi:hypothetical protein